MEVSPVQEQNYEFVALFFPNLGHGMLYLPLMACSFDKVLTDNKVFYFSIMTLPAYTTYHK